MNFDDLMAAATRAGDVSVPSSWAQGRTVYGGMSAGLLCDALSRGVDPARRLRYLSIAFAKPLVADQPFRIETDELAAGRTIIARTARIVQDGVVRVTAHGNFVAQLGGDTEIRPFRPREFAPPDSPEAFHMRGPGLPVFTQHMDFRAMTDGIPFQGHEVPELGGWMRLEDAPKVLTPSHLVCLIDTWPPAAVPYLSDVVPMSSITWNMHFGAPLDDVGGEDYLGYLARVDFFKDGYGSSTADVWAPDGRLLATSYQTFVVYG